MWAVRVGSGELERDFCEADDDMTPERNQLRDPLISLQFLLKINFKHLPPMKDVPCVVTDSNFHDYLPTQLSSLFPPIEGGGNAQDGAVADDQIGESDSEDDS